MRSEHPRLDRPPIVEALLDFSATFEESVSVDALRVEPSDVFGGEAQRSAIRTVTVGADLGTEGASGFASNSGVVGFRFENADRTRVAQFRTTGMTFSIVGAYTTWDDLVSEALEAFDVYQKAAGAPVPVRLSTRFINRFTVPFERPLDDFLRVRPAVPSGVEGGIVEFSLQTRIREPDARVEGALVLFTEGSDGPDAGSLILDVSAGSPEDLTLPLDGGGLGPAAEVLGKIRDFKNKFFFGSLTPYMVAQFRDDT